MNKNRCNKLQMFLKLSSSLLTSKWYHIAIWFVDSASNKCYTLNLSQLAYFFIIKFKNLGKSIIRWIKDGSTKSLLKVLVHANACTLLQQSCHPKQFQHLCSSSCASKQSKFITWSSISEHRLITVEAHAFQLNHMGAKSFKPHAWKLRIPNLSIN
jgi:hypothetical protein